MVDIKEVEEDIPFLFESLTQKLEQRKNLWLQLILGIAPQDEMLLTEDMFAVGLRFGLNDPNILTEHIQLRQRLIDPQKRFFTDETEIDIIARNGELIAFEIKTTGRGDDVVIFAHKVILLKEQHPDKTVRGVLVSPGAEWLRERCQRAGIELVA